MSVDQPANPPPTDAHSVGSPAQAAVAARRRSIPGSERVDGSAEVWIVRLVRFLPFGRTGAGCVLSASLVLGFTLTGAFARPGGSWGPGVGSAVFFSVFLPYTIVMTDYILDAMRRALVDLRPVLDFDDEVFEGRCAALSRFSKGEARWAIGCSSVAGAVHWIVIGGGLDAQSLGEVFQNPLDVAFFLTTVGVWIAMTCALTLLVRNAILFSRLGRAHTRILLLNIRTVHPYGRVAVLPALALLAGQAAYPLLWIGQEFQPLVVVPGFVTTLAPTFLLFALPLWSLHRRIRAAKEEALAPLQTRIDALAADEVPDSEQVTELAPLLSYRNAVEGVAEWPFDAPLLFRFALYIVIPPATWIAAALIENWIDSLV